MSSQFLAVGFDLRKPGAHKRRVLDFALDTYTQTVALILNFAEQNLSEIEERGQVQRNDEPTGKYNARSVSYALPKPGEVDADLAGSLKEAAVADAAATLASYLELRKADESTGFPVTFENVADARQQALEEFRTLADNLEREAELRSALLRRSRQTCRPITFKRSRDFALLYDPDDPRLFAWLPLLPAKNDLIDSPAVATGNLINVATGEPFKKRSKTAILVPLEVGFQDDRMGWQYEKFLGAVLEKRAAIKTAKLMRLGDDGEYRYRFNVSVDFDAPAPYKPAATVGVSPGVLMSAAYAVVDNEGSVVERYTADDGIASMYWNTQRIIRDKQRAGKRVTVRDYRGQARDELLHNTANAIIKIALRHQAMVALRQMNEREKPRYLRSPWSKLRFILQYKCALAGVPFRDEIFSAKCRTLCVACGHENRWRIEAEPCSGCGHVEEPILAEAINTARRVSYRKKDWSGGYLEFHREVAEGGRL